MNAKGTKLVTSVTINYCFPFLKRKSKFRRHPYLHQWNAGRLSAADVEKNMFYLTTVFMDMTAFSADRRKHLLTNPISKSCGFRMENR